MPDYSGLDDFMFGIAPTALQNIFVQDEHQIVEALWTDVVRFLTKSIKEELTGKTIPDGLVPDQSSFVVEKNVWKFCQIAFLHQCSTATKKVRNCLLFIRKLNSSGV